MVKKLSILVMCIALLQLKFAVAQLQNTVVITLKSEPTPLKPKEFYFKEIVDNRSNKIALGKLQPFKGGPFTAPYTVNFKDGSGGLIAFIKNSVVTDATLRPILVNINELSIAEGASANGVVKGSIKTAISFALEGSYVPVELTTYNTTTTYQRTAGPAQNIEPILQKALINGIIFFDNWINTRAGSNIKLAKAIKLSFTDYEEKADGDTIYYKPSRPLVWSDFTGQPPRTSKHGAEIFSYIGYNQEIDLRDETIYVKLALKSWVAKSACWVLPGMQNSYALNHEQRHFDITRLVTEHFKDRLKTTPLAPDTFEGEINTAYIDALRELTKLQMQYDSETSHGSDAGAQQESNIRIDNELAASGIKTLR